jgi:hypothetical protein
MPFEGHLRILKRPYKALKGPYKALKGPYKALKRPYKALKGPYKALGFCKSLEATSNKQTDKETETTTIRQQTIGTNNQRQTKPLTNMRREQT